MRGKVAVVGIAVVIVILTGIGWQGPATAWSSRLQDEGACPTASPGVSQDAMGWATPATVRLAEDIRSTPLPAQRSWIQDGRICMEPGARDRAPWDTYPANIIYVESGQLTLTISALASPTDSEPAGYAVIFRDGTAEQAELNADGIQLGRADSALLVNATIELSNESDEPTTYYWVALLTADPPACPPCPKPGP